MQMKMQIFLNLIMEFMMVDDTFAHMFAKAKVMLQVVMAAHHFTRKIGCGLFVNDTVPGPDYLLEEFNGDIIKNSVYEARCSRRRGGYGICVDDPVRSLL